MSVGFELEKMVHFGHLFEMIAIGTVGLVILLPNVARMWYFTILKPKVKVSLGKYVKALASYSFTCLHKTSPGLRRQSVPLVRTFYSGHRLLVVAVYYSGFGLVCIATFICYYLRLCDERHRFVVTVDFVRGRIQAKKKKGANTRNLPIFSLWYGCFDGFNRFSGSPVYRP